MRRKAIYVMIGLFFMMLLLLIGCGGGDVTQATPTPVGTTVNLMTFKSVYLGTSASAVYNFSLVGTDLQGNVWSGSYSLTANGTITFENQNVTSARSLLDVQTVNSATASHYTTYFQVADNSIYKRVYDDGFEFIPSTQSPLPNSPKVGDSGIIGTFTSNVGTPTTLTWNLNPDYNGTSILVFSSSFGTGSTAGPTEVYSYYLNASGVPTKITIKLNNGITTITLSGNKT